MIARLLLAATSVTALAAAAPPNTAPPEKGMPPITAQTIRSGGAIDPEQAKLTLDTVDLAIEVKPDSYTIAGVATLDFTIKAPLKRLLIDLDRNLPVTSVAIGTVALPASAWTNPDGRLIVTLPQRVDAGARLSATITYGGTPHVAVRAPWDGGFVWSKTPAGAPWIATAVQGEGCDLFWPCLDFPTAEPKSMAIHITVPRGLKAISNGRLIGTDTLVDGRTTWNWLVQHPTVYGIALNIAPYEVIRGTYHSRFGNSFPMEYWYLPGEQAKAEGLFAEFAPTLDFFESTVGPFPFAGDKMGVVETPHLGMEHQTINAYGNEYRKSPDGFDWLFQHEFSHEWFANQLTAADWDDMWLHEGYGAYMQPLYGRWRDGEARYAAMMEKSRNTIANHYPLVSGSPKTEEEVYKPDAGPGGDIYVKGAWMLHTLRNLLGDKAFSEITTREVYGRPDPKPGNFVPRYGSTKDYRQIVNDVTGADYGWFFDVYLSSAALPELVTTRNGSTLSLAWKTAGNKPFPMPIEISLDGQVQRLAMTGGKDSLTIPAGAHLVIDPWARVLRQNTAVDVYQAFLKAGGKPR